MAQARTKRINTGLYTFDNASGWFEIERFPDGSWMLFRIVTAASGADEREYVNDFNTKSEAYRFAHEHWFVKQAA